MSHIYGTKTPLKPCQNIQQEAGGFVLLRKNEKMEKRKFEEKLPASHPWLHHVYYTSSPHAKPWMNTIRNSKAYIIQRDTYNLSFKKRRCRDGTYGWRNYRKKNTYEEEKRGFYVCVLTFEPLGWFMKTGGWDRRERGVVGLRASWIG